MKRTTELSTLGGAHDGAAAPAARSGVYYGWIVVAVTALAILLSAGVRAVPGVFIHPIEVDLGWSRAAISFAVSVGLVLYGLGGPVGGQIMDRFGPRLVVVAGLLLAGLATAASAAMTELWQMTLLIGVLTGIGTGLVALVLGATVATRWFVARRGFVLGIFGAASSAGQMIFVPLLMALVVAIGWRASSLVMAAVALVAAVPVFLYFRNSPAEIGLEPYGGPAPAAAALPAADGTGGILRRALAVPEFWLLAGSFFICGATSNGIIGVHFIPHSIDHGIPDVVAAGTLALMGGMNFVGTLFSGWLTDRYDPRRLLAVYYIFRGLALFVLPLVLDFPGLGLFAVVFGLDYIATVPPTSALCADIFGRKHVGVIFGWVFCAHQLGAASAAYLGGVARVYFGDYQLAFLAAGLLAVIGGLLALRIGPPRWSFAEA